MIKSNFWLPLTVLGILCVLFAFLSIQIPTIRDEEVFESGLNQGDELNITESEEMTFWCFKQIWMALIEYDSAYGSLPYPAVLEKKGDLDALPLTSWRFSILPWFANYGREIDPMISWDSESNSWWRDVPQCYSYGGWQDGIQSIGKPGINQETRVFAVTGRGSAFGDGSYRPLSVKEIGFDTILLVEIRNSKCHWMEPKDLDINSTRTAVDAAISSIHNKGFFVLFADGEVWQLKHITPVEDLKKFFFPHKLKAFKREEVLGRYRVQKTMRENGENPR